MPDINKMDALHKAGYNVPVTCGLCVHGNFDQGFSMWGTCGVIHYDHAKHTGPDRDASIVRCGTCPQAVLDRDLINQFGSHREFACQK